MATIGMSDTPFELESLTGSGLAGAEACMRVNLRTFRFFAATLPFALHQGGTTYNAAAECGLWRRTYDSRDQAVWHAR